MYGERVCVTIRCPLGSSAVWSARFSLSLSIYLSNHKRRPGGVLLLRVSLSTGAAEAWHRVVFSEKRFKKQGICPNVLKHDLRQSAGAPAFHYRRLTP